MGLEFTNYEIEGKIGDGAFGPVYSGTRKQDGHRVAIRVMPEGLVDSRRAKDRFSREMRKVATLHHVTLCRLLEFGEVQGQLAVIMEYMEGTPLSRLLGSPPQAMPHTRAIQIVREVLKGMNYVHGKGLIHGDISPGNIFVGQQGDIKIADLGVAGGLSFGTASSPHLPARLLCYMAPEYLLEGVVDARTDVYSIGMVLYKTLVGPMPLALDEITEQDVMRVVLRKPLPPAREVNPQVPAWLQEVLTEALSHDPSRRLRSCEAFLNRL
ncbi:serine/threonine protein kinase [Candidatus Fermentibacterales bacterium]|nr:serine/threonine protein kinase [Candidatus Fermentibacterales bacterium]